MGTEDKDDEIQIIKIEPQPILLKDYIGDGVYALFDGFGIWLHANDHEHPTDRIYLEPGVLKGLKNFEERCSQLGKKDEGKGTFSETVG